jgi:hypothetical protein
MTEGREWTRQRLDKLAFTLTATSTYAEAAAVAQKWGADISAAALHSLVQRLGTRGEVRTQARLATVPVEREPQRAPTPLAVLLLDGWQVRQRGPGWGAPETEENRVEWHEWKTGVYYRQEQAGTTAGGRGVLTEKLIIGWQGEPLEFGKRLHWEALRGGLGRAQARLVVADGAPWIWNVAQDRWRGPPSCWTFIMPASTSGTWAGRYMARTLPPPPSGSSPAATNCGMARNNAS